MSLKVLQALHTLLGAHIKQQSRGQLRNGRAYPGSLGTDDSSANPLQGGNSDNMRVQPPSVRPRDIQVQGGRYNPGNIPLQGSRGVRPIQGGRPWYDY